MRRILMTAFFACLFFWGSLEGFSFAMEENTSNSQQRRYQISPAEQQAQHEHNRSIIQRRQADAYRKHLAGLSKPLNYKKEIEGSRKVPGANVYYPKKVYRTSNPPAATTLKTQKRIGRPAAALSNSQPLTDSDYTFLKEMSEHIEGEDRSKRLDQIMERQKEGGLLPKEDYEFLNDMGRKIKDAKVSYRLHQIAEKRRKNVY